jgi:hypothetical protein
MPHSADLLPRGRYDERTVQEPLTSAVRVMRWYLPLRPCR